MTLNEYLNEATDENGKPLSDAAFGELCCMSQSQVSRLRNGKSRPSYEAMIAIYEASGNKVTPNDWFDALQAAE